MLELRNIVKDYVNGNNVTHALKGISVSFRKNEFVSILGASGCGKTTTLNIIGGLDRYTSGDLLIKGKSTKEYKDRDWDTYRNHSIGFVFQTYNLIAHQTILKNVELALTISGIHSFERKKRAMVALEKVGLKGMEKKKPNQLSGGQCQRVAIARALVNNPSILLADEPTGALDSKTSVQIMDLLKEVAADRLVIMVTHNPTLAKKYSTRIITMSDGKLVKDSDPYNYVPKKLIPKKTKKIKKSSMSIFTSTKLSFSNLFSKLKRTILVTIAGSIGIIGVSSVLAVSRGIKDYIASMQNDLLSSYPISIAEESTDYSSLMTAFGESNKKNVYKFDPKNPKVGVDSMVEYLMSAYKDITSVKTNTIDKNLMAFIDAIPSEASVVTKYNYGIEVTNNIFTDWKISDTLTKNYSLNGLTQSYISELQTVKGFSEYASYVSLFTDFMSEIPDSTEYVLDQYDLIAGEEPTFADDELIVVVDKNTTLTDILFAEMGIYDREDFINLATNSIDLQNILRNQDLTQEEKDAQIEKLSDKSKRDFDYDEILGKKYTYFDQNTIFEDGSVDDTLKQKKISFVDVNNSSSYDFTFDDSANKYVGTKIDGNTFTTSNINLAEQESAVNFNEINSYLNSIDVDSLLNNPLVMSLYFVFTKEQVRDMLTAIKGVDLSTLGLLKTYKGTDYNDNAYTVIASNSSNIGFVIYKDAEDTSKDYSGLILNLSGNVVYESLPPKGQYSYSAETKSSWGKGHDLKVKCILRLKENMNFGCLQRGVYYTKAFSQKYMHDAYDAKVTNELENFINSDESKTKTFDAYVRYEYFNHYENDEIRTTKSTIFKSGGASSITDLISSFTGSSGAEYNIEHLRALSGLKPVKNSDSSEYTFEALPKSFSIYPKNFEKKDEITSYLDKWNSKETLRLHVDDKDVVLTPEDRDELTYEDTIELIISVINTLIEAVTVALIAFTSLSLIVSCFMIAVITYISVVERIKEIGVIRSLGGRKRDVANLFVMETLLTGLFSGLFGVAVTYILQIIANAILVKLFGIAIAHLTLVTALIMISISTLLSVLSGLIPSQSAAHKDPVIALRSND